MSRVSLWKSRLLWVTGSLGTLYAGFKYAQYKWTEFEDKQREDATVRAKYVLLSDTRSIKKRFLQNQQDVEFAVQSLLSPLLESLGLELNVDWMVVALQSKRHADDAVPADQKSKRELWEELKVTSFTRLVSSLYLIVLLSVFTHVQLNILGRLFYMESVAQLSNEAASSRQLITEETERKFLTFSWYLLNVGWLKCVRQVKASVTKVFGQVSLKEPISIELLQDMMVSIRDEIESDLGVFLSYLLPEEGKEETLLKECGVGDYGIEMSQVQGLVDKDLLNLVNETRDYLEWFVSKTDSVSPDFPRVLSQTLDDAFSQLHQSLRTLYEDGSNDLSVQNASIPLAGLIPKINKICPQLPSLLESVNRNASLTSFCMIIYAPVLD